MEEGPTQSVLDSILNEDEFEVGEDIEMMDAEEGEMLEQEDPQADVGKSGSGDGDVAMDNQGPQSKNKKHRGKKKRKNKKRRNDLGQKPVDINRFVSDTCRRLREKKSYMVYTAVGCLGISALSDIVREVDAVLACGGQMTADGRRYRTGGGVLWNIIKTREPAAYKEIMKKAREFEKQFRQQNKSQAPRLNKDVSFVETALPPTKEGASTRVEDDSQLMAQNQPEQSGTEGKSKAVHERIRVPVSYDDLLGEDTKAESV